MHALFEGVLQYEGNFVFQHSINHRYFFPWLLSQKMEHMELGYMEASDRPTPLTAQVLNSSDRSVGWKGTSTCEL